MSLEQVNIANLHYRREAEKEAAAAQSSETKMSTTLTRAMKKLGLADRESDRDAAIIRKLRAEVLFLNERETNRDAAIIRELRSENLFMKKKLEDAIKDAEKMKLVMTRMLDARKTN